jgi:hypothetical protein
MKGNAFYCFQGETGLDEAGIHNRERVVRKILTGKPELFLNHCRIRFPVSPTEETTMKKIALLVLTCLGVLTAPAWTEDGIRQETVQSGSEARLGDCQSSLYGWAKVERCPTVRSSD